MNRLASEKSPYLLQHKDNPVWWYAWGAEAFEEAKRSNKPVFLSIGYSTCHWCHVMERESFEQEDVAEILNKSYVSIKVDREERPDVDDIYMSALQALTGGGGWPMSVWLTPEGKPFFAGTYFPKDRFKMMLERIAELWVSDGDRVREDGETMAQAVAKHSKLKESPLENERLQDLPQAFIQSFQGALDLVHGGFGGAPKFPQSMSLIAMMRIDQRSVDRKAEGIVRNTLDNMHRGGMYDHLVGGFHRYSVDEKWLVPHFEKMLYDNAFLSSAYLEAFQCYGEEEYARVARETLDFTLNEMTHPEGGFYSALDADSAVPGTDKKEEGFFYTFSYSEIEGQLSQEELEMLEEVYGFEPKGVFEGRNILHLKGTYTREAKQNLTLTSALAKLQQIRREKPRPHLDDKIITAWNGWMMASMAQAYQVLREERYLKAAQKAAQFILDHLEQDGRLMRRWRDGEARINAYSDDYAAMIYALLNLYEADFNPKWLTEALRFQSRLDELFWDQDQGAYFRDDGSDPLLITRKKEDYDGVRPNANSLSSYNLLRFYHLTLNLEFKEQAERLFALYMDQMERVPSSLPQMMTGLDFYLAKIKEVVVSESEPGESQGFIEALQKGYQPHKVVVKLDSSQDIPPEIQLAQGKSAQDGQTTYYVCEVGACHQPTTDKSQALNQALN